MTGNEDHSISLEDAAKLTKTYRKTAFPTIASSLVKIQAEAFGQNAIQSVLDQTDAVGIRIYYGLDLLPDPTFRLIIVGVNTNDDDLVDGIILDGGILCPPNCATDNALNS